MVEAFLRLPGVNGTRRSLKGPADAEQEGQDVGVCPWDFPARLWGIPGRGSFRHLHIRFPEHSGPRGPATSGAASEMKGQICLMGWSPPHLSGRPPSPEP